MTQVNKENLIKKYNLKDSQYEYELKRSIKKNIPINDWLKEKYKVVKLPTQSKDKTLFHFTRSHYLPNILKYGIIFGDVVISPTKGLNCPNLTSEGFFHDPGSKKDTIKLTDIFDPNSYLRLVIKVNRNDNRLINYQVFDKNVCKGINQRLINRDKNNDSNLSKQFLFKGTVDPSMIVRVDVYDQNLGKFRTLNSNEIDKICDLYKDLFSLLPNHLRILGFQEIDYSGSIKRFRFKTDQNSPWGELYKLSDYLLQKLKGNDRQLYFKELGPLCGQNRKGTIDVNMLITYLFNTYNDIVPSNKKLDQDMWVNNLIDKISKNEEQWKLVNDKREQLRNCDFLEVS